MKKRLFALILSIIAIVSFTACSVNKIKTNQMSVDEFKRIAEEFGLTVKDVEYSKGLEVNAEGKNIHAEYYIVSDIDDMDSQVYKLMMVGVTGVFGTAQYQSEEAYEGYKGVIAYDKNKKEKKIYASYKGNAILYITNTSAEGYEVVEEFAKKLAY